MTEALTEALVAKSGRVEVGNADRPQGLAGARDDTVCGRCRYSSSLGIRHQTWELPRTPIITVPVFLKIIIHKMGENEVNRYVAANALPPSLSAFSVLASAAPLKADLN